MFSDVWDDSYVSLPATEVVEIELREALTHALQDTTLYNGRLPASTERSSQGLFAFLDRTTYVKSGPAWVASQKHRPSSTRKRAERPVSEGPQKNQGASGEDNPCFDESLPHGGAGIVRLVHDISGRGRKSVVGFHPWGTYV